MQKNLHAQTYIEVRKLLDKNFRKKHTWVVYMVLISSALLTVLCSVQPDCLFIPVKKLNFDVINFFIARGPEYYADMLEIRKSFHFDMLIADCAFTGIPFVTDKMKLPVISVGVFPLTETSRDLGPNGLGY